MQSQMYYNRDISVSFPPFLTVFCNHFRLRDVTPTLPNYKLPFPFSLRAIPHHTAHASHADWRHINVNTSFLWFQQKKKKGGKIERKLCFLNSREEG